MWARMVGGEQTTKTGGSAAYAYNAPGLPAVDSNGSTVCNTKFQQSFAGVQIGQDIGKLNINGWNVHLGTTAGVIGTQGQIVNGNTPAGGTFNTTTQAPFVGTYLVATQGNFFIDGLVRFDYYQTNLDSPTINLFNQSLDAYGYSVSSSAGYHWDVPNTQVVHRTVGRDDLERHQGRRPGDGGPIGEFGGCAHSPGLQGDDLHQRPDVSGRTRRRSRWYLVGHRRAGAAAVRGGKHLA